MSNFIRGVFCLHQLPFEFDSISNLFTTMSELGISFYPQHTRAVTGQILIDSKYIPISQQLFVGMSEVEILKQVTDWIILEGYLKISLQWRLRGSTYNAHFEFTGKHKIRKLAFCVEEQVFLFGQNILYDPDNDPVFESYKRALLQIIKSLRPSLGTIDYENDFLCRHKEPDSSIVSWGNYFPFSTLAKQEGCVEKIKSIVSEYVIINNIGILTFIHPLQANQAWTDQHKELQSILVGLWENA